MPSRTVKRHVGRGTILCAAVLLCLPCNHQETPQILELPQEGSLSPLPLGPRGSREILGLTSEFALCREDNYSAQCVTGVCPELGMWCSAVGSPSPHSSKKENQGSWTGQWMIEHVQGAVCT